MLTRKLFNVSGKFVIPGTRDVATFSGRVFAATMQAGSKDLAAKLQEDFGWKRERDEVKRAPRDFKFSPDFALMHLRWEEKPILPTAPKVEEEVVLAALAATGAVISPIEQREIVEAEAVHASKMATLPEKVI